MNQEEEIIDLTNSFVLINHGHVYDEIIELDTDDSFDELNNTKEKKPTSEKHKILTTSKKQSPTKLYGFGDCAICYEELGKNPLASTKCGHVYCLKCLETWLDTNKMCPICRSSLKKLSAYHPLYFCK